MNDYPILLVHGIIVKEFLFFKAFGGIERMLKKAGYTVFTADTDGFGTIENNAAQLKAYAEKVLAQTGTEKVHIIAHSKGGLDAKYALSVLGLKEHVASLTTLCTPHRGSGIATWLYSRPRRLMKFIAFWIDLWYRICRDRHPDSYAVCQQLCSTEDEISFGGLGSVYCQSFSSAIGSCKDDFLLSIPLLISRHCKEGDSDGIVTVESSRFAYYRGNCLDEKASHSEIIGLARKKKREKVYAFYLGLCGELVGMSFPQEDEAKKLPESV